MKVIFDISVLGLGMQALTSRTGIFRVVENLALHLTKKGVIQQYDYGGNLQEYFSCKKYLDENLALDIPLMMPTSSDLIMSALFYLSKNSPITKKTHLHVRAINRLINRTLPKKIVYGNRYDNIIKNADIYHSPFHPVPAAIAESKLRKVVTIHDLIPLMFPHFFENVGQTAVEKVIKSISDDFWITCVSMSTRNDLCNMFPKINPDRVFVTQLAASDSFYRVRDDDLIERTKRKYGIPEGHYVLALSTLEPRKNLLQLINSYIALVRTQGIKDLNLVLVGTAGWKYESIFSQIESASDFKGKIIVTGFVEDEFLAPLYSGAMMFAYPSLYEGFGLPILEAMKCGVPVVSSSVSSMPEVVGDAGMLINPKDGDELSQAILNIYESTSLRKKMQLASLRRSNQFSWEKCAEQTIEVYKAALSGQ